MVENKLCSNMVKLRKSCLIAIIISQMWPKTSTHFSTPTLHNLHRVMAWPKPPSLRWSRGSPVHPLAQQLLLGWRRFVAGAPPARWPAAALPAALGTDPQGRRTASSFGGPCRSGTCGRNGRVILVVNGLELSWWFVMGMLMVDHCWLLDFNGG